MAVKTEFSDGVLTAFLSGEIDHHNAPSIRESIDELYINRRPQILRLDFGGVTFMDSSGIGLVMGRYRLMQGDECRLEITNLSTHSYKVMKLAGLEQIALLTRSKGDTHKNESA